jgi:hypothetical protein
MISYDLKKPGQDYATLIKAIKSISGDWCHPLESTWVVPTSLSAVQVRDRLKPYMDSNDSILVVNITNDDYSGYLDDRAVTWLRTHM